MSERPAGPLARARSSRFAVESAQLTATTVVTAVLGAVQTVVLARWLGPVTFGVVALATAFPTLVFAIFDARSESAAIRFASRYWSEGRPERVAAAVRLSLATDVLVAAAGIGATALAAGWAASSLADGGVDAWVLVLFALGFLPAAAGATSASALVVVGRVRTRALTEGATAVLRTGLVVAAAASGSPTAVVLTMAVGTALSGLALLATATVALRQSCGRTWAAARTADLGSDRKAMLRFLVVTDLTELASLAYKQLDTVLIGAVQGPAAAGLYRLARSAATILGLPLAPLTTLTYQRMAAQAHSPLRLKEFTRRIVRTAALPLAGAMVVGGAVLAGVITVVTGPAYERIAPALALWVAGYAVFAACYWLRPLYLVFDRAGFWLGLNVAASVVFLVAGFTAAHAGGFVLFTAARTFSPLVVHLGALAMLRRMWAARLREGWVTKAGARVWIDQEREGRRKRMAAAPPDHAGFIAAVAQHPHVAAWFPAVRVVGGREGPVLEVAWVDGRVLGTLETPQLAAVAAFQAHLHHMPLPAAPARFDYVRFMLDRAEADMDGMDSTTRGAVESVRAALAGGRGGGCVAHPDIHAGNLVWQDGTFKVIDLELLTVLACPAIDLITTAASARLGDGAVHAYLSAYRDAGGDLGRVAATFDAAAAIWQLRLHLARSDGPGRGGAVLDDPRPQLRSAMDELAQRV